MVRHVSASPSHCLQELKGGALSTKSKTFLFPSTRFMFCHLFHFFFNKKKKRRKSINANKIDSQSRVSVKSVRFAKASKDNVFYTHSTQDYDRRSSFAFPEQCREGNVLKKQHANDEDDEVWSVDEEVARNTGINRKRSHHSVAVLVAYRSNIK